jgi:DNA primase
LVELSEERKLKILKEILGDYYNSTDESLFSCPNCSHHKKKLSININKNVFKCWVCDWSGKNIYRIIRIYGTTDHRYEWKSFTRQVEIENFSDKLFEKPAEKEEKTTELPAEFISLANKNLSSTALRPFNYLKSRGLTKNDVIKWKIGYCCDGEYAGRIIVPSFNINGDVNYFISRSYDNNWKKYSNPNISKDIIFNHPYIDFDEDLILVEGVFDAIKSGDNSIPLLGSTLNDRSKLFYEIVKNDTPVYLALDPDASKKTNKLVNLFLRYDIETHVVSVSPFGDVGEMSSEQFKERKLSAVLLNSNNYLLGRIEGI